MVEAEALVVILVCAGIAPSSEGIKGVEQPLEVMVGISTSVSAARTPVESGDLARSEGAVSKWSSTAVHPGESRFDLLFTYISRDGGE